MKKFVFTLFAVAALIACQSNNKQNQMTGEGEARRNRRNRLDRAGRCIRL